MFCYQTDRHKTGGAYKREGGDYNWHFYGTPFAWVDNGGVPLIKIMFYNPKNAKKERAWGCQFRIFV